MSDKPFTRRDTLKGAAAIGLAQSLTSLARADHMEGLEPGPDQTAPVTEEELASWRNPALIEHTRSATMLVNRERAYETMDRYGLDGLVAATPLNVYYLSSHRGPMQMMGRDFSTYALLPRDESAPAALIVPGSMLYHLDYLPTWMPSVQVYTWPAAGAEPDASGDIAASPFVSPWAMQLRSGDLHQADRVLMALYAEYHGKTSASALHGLKAALKDAGLTKGRLGFDDPRVLGWLRNKGLGDLDGMDAMNVFKEIRMVKSPAEIEILREASMRNEQALDYAIEQIEPGMDVLDIERAHARKWGELEGHARWLVTNIRGLNSGRVQSGDFMKLDSVGEYKGYLGDVGRTVSVGEPSDELLRRTEANQAASAAVYSAIRPGMGFMAAAELFGEVLREQGFEHGPAGPHPVGLIHTDLPWPTGDENPSFNQMQFGFEENMVFTLDMPYHEIGWGTTHVEDMMLVTATGAVPLSSGRMELRIRPG
jgi:Xaa-Pro aminopeptidase